MKFHEILKRVRLSNGLTLRAAAQQIGISHMALYNVERGQDSSGETFFLIFRWLMTPEKKVA